MTTTRLNPESFLPHAVEEEILSYLSISKLVSLAPVSQSWHTTAIDEKFQKKVLLKQSSEAKDQLHHHLIPAVIKKNLFLIQHLLTLGVNINKELPEGKEKKELNIPRRRFLPTVLDIAVVLEGKSETPNDLRVVQLLLRSKANVTRDHENLTAFRNPTQNDENNQQSSTYYYSPTIRALIHLARFENEFKNTLTQGTFTYIHQSLLLDAHSANPTFVKEYIESLASTAPESSFQGVQEELTQNDRHSLLTAPQFKRIDTHILRPGFIRRAGSSRAVGNFLAIFIIFQYIGSWLGGKEMLDLIADLPTFLLFLGSVIFVTETLHERASSIHRRPNSAQRRLQPYQAHFPIHFDELSTRPKTFTKMTGLFFKPAPSLTGRQDNKENECVATSLRLSHQRRPQPPT